MALSEGDFTHEDGNQCLSLRKFKARPFKKIIFEKADSLPQVEKRGKTSFEEFKLSNPECVLRNKSLIEYQKELERMKNARFRARSFDKNRYEKSGDKRCLSDSGSVKKLTIARI